jgi:hypothetical protein
MTKCEESDPTKLVLRKCAARRMGKAESVDTNGDKTPVGGREVFRTCFPI